MPRPLKGTLLLAVLLSATATTGCAPGIPIGTEPYAVAGQGGPVVVFDGAFGETRHTWRPIWPAIAMETTVFAFERPGYRVMSRVPNPATVASDGMTTLSEQAQHLHTLLADAHLAPPYVLVGHSLGGVTLMAFAKYYPDEVAGIVFADGRLPNYTAACQAARLEPCIFPRELISGGDFYIAEIDGLVATEATEAAQVSELGDVPVTFIVATRAEPSLVDPDAERRRATWIAYQRASARSVRDSRYVEAARSGHYVHEDQPELVIEEIRNMLARVRTGAWPIP